MILAQVRDEMNRVNQVLDEFESPHGRWRNRGRRDQLLDMAVRASIRGVETLITDRETAIPWLPEPGSEYHLLESMRQDEALLRALVTAECQLLSDLGLSSMAVERVRRSLDAVLLHPTAEPGLTAVALQQLIDALRSDLELLNHQASDALVVRRLAGVFEALGGGLIIAADSLIGAGAAPFTGGLSIAGAGVSIAAGTEMLSRGVARAVDS